jgi:muconolactone delta-isomerase
VQKAAIYALAGLLLTAASLAANHLVPRVPVVRARPIHLEHLPQTIGAWRVEKAGEGADERKSRLQASAFVCRLYRRNGGPRLELILAVSTSKERLSDPLNSLPPGNWRILDRKESVYAGQQFTEVTADNLFQQYRVLFSVQQLDQEQERRGALENLQSFHDRMQNRRRRVRWLLTRVSVPARHRQAEEIRPFWKTLSAKVHVLVGSAQ